MLKFQTVVAVFSIVLSLDSILERSFHLLRLSCPSDNSQKCRRILRKEGTSDISSLSVGGLHQMNISLPAEFKTYIQGDYIFLILSLHHKVEGIEIVNCLIIQTDEQSENICKIFRKLAIILI